MEAKEGEKMSGPQADQRKPFSLKRGDYLMTGYLEGVTMTEDDTFFSIHMQFLHILHVCRAVCGFTPSVYRFLTQN
jgi:hypothetical protein